MMFNESIMRLINTKDKPFFLSKVQLYANASKPTGKEYRSKGKVIITSLTNNIPPPLSFWSNLYTVEYPWMKNRFAGKVASNFVLLMRISILPPMSDESNSNLFLMEFILRYPTIILSLLVPTWMIMMLSGFFLRCGTTKTWYPELWHQGKF